MKFVLGILLAHPSALGLRLQCNPLHSRTSLTGNRATAMHMSQMDDAGVEDVNGRRYFLKHSIASLAGVAAPTILPQVANAGLLEEFGTDPSKINDPDEDKNKSRESFQYAAKKESNLEPNLRSNYYYPTNKKRYLPRIKKCSDAIEDVATMIGNEDWEGVEYFVTNIADDTILPMKLYTSSLLGQGTNVKVAFAREMNQATKDFEAAQKKLLKFSAKKNQEKSSDALEELASAMLAYRTAGRLLGPDAGRDIPSVDEIRRTSSRYQGRSYTEKYKNQYEMQ